MMVQIRDINWNFHHFINGEELRDFITTYSDEYDFIYHDHCGEKINIIELIMIRKEK